MAQAQLRVVRRDQLRALGWAYHHIEHEIAMDRWHQVAPEVIALQNAPLVGDQLLWLGVLHAGPGAALSHRTACAQAGLQRWEHDIIDVISAKGNTVERLDGFFFHETRRPYLPWVDTSASPPRLVLEKAALLAAERERGIRAGVGLLAACVQQRLTTAERLWESAHEVTKLRHGRQIRLALGDIAGGAQSFAEIDIGRLCDRFGLQRPARQALRRDRQGRRRYLDCEWELPGGRVVVLEIDGSFHLRAEHWWRDMQRERDVVLSGRVVLRCGALEIRLEPDRIMADLEQAGIPRVRRPAA